MDTENKNKAASELGKLGGQKTAEKGPEYYAEIQAKRKVRAGGRPKSPPQAAHEGVLKIGNLEIPCAVLENGDRVLSERAITKALGGKRGGSHWRRMKEGGAEMPLYLSANNLKPFIDSELELALKTPILYRPKGGGGTAYGRKAELLPKMCDVLLKAREAGKLRGQGHIAAKAEILVRGFAHVGIIALVDEATGYQYLRAREALEEILEKFIATEFRKWAKTFPDEFYRELFRLRGWEFKEATVKRTPLIGKLTLDLVYDRLAPGVRQRLEEINPKNEKGYRKHKLFQRLTKDVGDPSLRAHLASVITLMKAVDAETGGAWGIFMKMMNRALPKYKHLPLFDPPQLNGRVAT